ncbi:MAG: hypothetical protein ACFCD0_24135, partial [Gemmataceae bacterium]
DTLATLVAKFGSLSLRPGIFSRFKPPADLVWSGVETTKSSRDNLQSLRTPCFEGQRRISARLFKWIAEFDLINNQARSPIFLAENKLWLQNSNITTTPAKVSLFSMRTSEITHGEVTGNRY